LVTPLNSATNQHKLAPINRAKAFLNHGITRDEKSDKIKKLLDRINKINKNKNKD